MMKPFLLMFATLSLWLLSGSAVKAETTWSVMPREILLPMHNIAPQVADGASGSSIGGKDKPFNLASAVSDVVFTLSMGLLTIVFMLIAIIFVLVYSLFKSGKLNFGGEKKSPETTAH